MIDNISSVNVLLVSPISGKRIDADTQRVLREYVQQPAWPVCAIGTLLHMSAEGALLSN